MTGEAAGGASTLEEDAGPIRPGLRLGNYEVERQIGVGGFGTVFAARHIGLDKPVVLKALHHTLAASQTSVLRFIREGRAASKIRHPHVVDVTDVGTHEGIPFLVMEYLEGEDLEARLETRERFVPADIARIMLPVFDALATAHDEGIVHRDLKPSNIFLAKGPHGSEIPKLLDFGIAKILDPDPSSIALTRAASFVGTPYYVSPEQAKSGRDADARSDQYSLGALLFQLATGEVPVEGGTAFEVLGAIVAKESKTFEQTYPGGNPVLGAIIGRAMEYEPADRYPSVRHMGRDLLALAEPDDVARWRAAFGVVKPRAVIGGSPETSGQIELEETLAPGAVIASALPRPEGMLETRAHTPVPPPAAEAAPSEVERRSFSEPPAAASAGAASAAAVSPAAVSPAAVSPAAVSAAAVSRVAPPTSSVAPVASSPPPAFRRPEPVAAAVAETPAGRGGLWAALLVAALLVLFVGAGAAAYALGVFEPEGPPTASETEATREAPSRVWLTASEPSAVIELDGSPIGTGRAEIPRDGRPHRVRVTAEGFEPHEQRVPADPEGPITVALTAAEVEAPEPVAADDPPDPEEVPVAAPVEEPEPTPAARGRRTGRTGQPPANGQTWSRSGAAGRSTPNTTGRYGTGFGSRGGSPSGGTPSSGTGFRRGGTQIGVGTNGAPVLR